MMKNFKWRAAALAGALAFLSAGAVFAQDAEGEAVAEQSAGSKGKLTVSGYINAGADIKFPGATKKDYPKSGSSDYETKTFRDGGDTTIEGYAHDVDDGSAFQVKLGANYDHGNWGAAAQIRSDDYESDRKPQHPKFSEFDWVYLKYAYGWFKPNDYLKLQGGFVAEGDFETQGDIADDVGEGFGFTAHFYPVGGLNIGTGLYAGRDNSGKLAGNPDTLVIGVAYNLENLGLTFEGSAKWKSLWTDTAASNPYDHTNFDSMLLGVQFTKVENLSVILEAKVWDYGTGYFYKKSAEDPFGKWGGANFLLNLQAEYKIGNLKPGILMYYYLNNFRIKGDVNGNPLEEQTHINSWAAWNPDDNRSGINISNVANISTVETPIDFTMKPYISYALLDGKIVPTLAATLGFGSNHVGDVKIDNLPSVVDLKNYKVNRFTAEVNPYADFFFGTARVRVGYKFSADSVSVANKKNEPLLGLATEHLDNTTFNNKITFDFLYSF